MRLSLKKGWKNIVISVNQTRKKIRALVEKWINPNVRKEMKKIFCWKPRTPQERTKIHPTAIAVQGKLLNLMTLDCLAMRKRKKYRLKLKLEWMMLHQSALLQQKILTLMEL